MIEVETSAASAPERSGLSDLEARAVRAVEACLLSRTSAAAAAAAGEALLNLKSVLRHGAFGPWIEANLPVTSRTVRQYVEAYRKAADAPEVARWGSGRRREANPAEELRALLLALSVIARQGAPLVQLVEESVRGRLAEQAREAAALMERLASELSGGKVQ